MRKFLGITIGLVVLAAVCYFSFMYFASYSDGDRTGQLVKFSHKGMVLKTWEGEINQGISGGQVFAFSVLDSDEKVISDLKDLEGQYVKVSYVERYKTFPWWGDTKYFVTAVKKESSPFNIK